LPKAVPRAPSFPLSSDQLPCPAADPARNAFQTALCDPIVDRPQRVGEILPVTARSSRMHDPMLRPVLNEERMERNEAIRESERIPTALDIDLDRRRGVALGEADAQTRMLAHPQLLSCACLHVVIG